MEPIINIAGYHFAPLENLPEFKKKLEQLSLELSLKGTILISVEGINLFMAGLRHATDALLAEIRQISGFAEFNVKESISHKPPFRRLLVKIKKEIISFGVEGIHPANYSSPKITPHELRKWLDEKKPVVLLDTRNNYEIRMGTFQGAFPADIHHFRDFPQAVKKLPQDFKEKTIVTFCTGGIRCEKAAPFMEREGFKNIFQLEGGILNYFKECGSLHYQGECFVFDKRVGVDSQLHETKSILCFQCQMPLKEEDQAHVHYHVNVSCPYCFGREKKKKAPNTRKSRRMKKEAALKETALSSRFPAHSSQLAHEIE